MSYSSSAHSTVFGDNRQGTAATVASTESTSATPKSAMSCVCRWKSIDDLTRHYRKCSYIKGDWAFWACPYTLEGIFRDRQASINHIKSFKPVEKRIAATETLHVTALDWAMDYTRDAKKRQLENTVLGYFDANPTLFEDWKYLNRGELIPDVVNAADLADVDKILKLSSILRRRHP